MHQSRLVLPTPLALPCLIALACLCTVHLVLGGYPYPQGAFSQTEKHTHGEKVRHKIATKTKTVEKGGHCPLVHTALRRAPHAFGKLAEWHDECIVGDGVRGRFRLSSG